MDIIPENPPDNTIPEKYITVRDHRDKDWFWANNVLYDEVLLPTGDPTTFAKVLGASTLSVYMFLARLADNKTQTCYPSYPTMEKRCGLSHGTVIISIHKLADHGLISVKKRESAEGDNTSNLYTLLPASNWKIGGGIADILPSVRSRMKPKDGNSGAKTTKKKTPRSTKNQLPGVDPSYYGSTPNVPKQNPPYPEPFEKSSKEQQQPVQNGNAAVVGFSNDFQFGDLNIESTIQGFLKEDTGLAEALIRKEVEADPEHAAQQLIWWKDRPQASEKWCAEHNKSRSGALRRILEYKPGHEKYWGEPALVKMRRRQKESREARLAEAREEAEAQRRKEAEAREISALKRKDAANAINHWRMLSAPAKRYIEDRAAQEKPLLAAKVGRTANNKGIETIEAGSPTWVEYLELVHIYLPDALEKFPMVGQADDSAATADPAESPEELSAAEKKRRDYEAGMQNTIDSYAGLIISKEMTREQLEEERDFLDFKDSEWKRLIDGINKKIEESQS